MGSVPRNFDSSYFKPPKTGVIVATGPTTTARSYHRLAALLGISVGTLGLWFGARYIYYNYYLGGGQRSRDSDEGTISANIDYNNPSLISTTSESFSTENVLVPTESLENKAKASVILHQSPRGYFTPSISPFPFKLETYLRVARIPYEIGSSFNMKNFASQLQQDKNSPWVTINGTDILEAHHCVPELNTAFGIDLEKNANKSRQTACRLIASLLEYKIYWGIALWRWVFDEGKSIQNIQPLNQASLEVVPDVSESIQKASMYHGLGRREPDQIFQIIMKDLADMAAALGRHTYFLGNSPGEVDCAAFALLSQMVWNMPGSPYESGIRKFENLMKFVYRMKETYWPDWDALLQPKSIQDPLRSSDSSDGFPDNASSSEKVNEEIVDLAAGSLNHTIEGSATNVDYVEQPQVIQEQLATSSAEATAPFSPNLTVESTTPPVPARPAVDYSSLVVNQDKKLAEQQQQQQQRELLLQSIGIHSDTPRHIQDQLINIARKLKLGIRLDSDEVLQWQVHSEQLKRASYGYSSAPNQPYFTRPVTAAHNYYQPPYNDDYQRQEEPLPNYYSPRSNNGYID